MLVAFWSGLFCGINLPPLRQTDCATEREKSSSVLAHIGISFLHSRSGVLTYFQAKEQVKEGFQVAGSPDPEAKRLNVLFALPLK